LVDDVKNNDSMKKIKSAHVRECVESLRDQLVDLARDLVRIPSVTGEETPAQQFLVERLQDWGLRVDLWIPERAEVAGHPAFCDDGIPIERANLVAQWGEGNRAQAALILNGHIDVVPVGDLSQWDGDPFEGTIHNQILYGRGSCDMKGGLAAASIAILAAQKLGLEPKRPVLLQSVIGEETGGLGTLAAILRGYRADAAVICEPTRLAMCPVASGALSFRLRVPGSATHGATPAAGVHAVEKLWLVWKALGDLENDRHRGFHHPAFDPETLAAPISIGKVRAGDWPSTVPDEANAEGRFGVFPGEDCASARKQFEEAVRAAASQDEWLSRHPVQVEWFEGQFEPGETDPRSPILGELAESHYAVTQQELRTHGVPWGNDLRLFTRYAKVPAVLYGPGDVLLAHAANEHVSLDELAVAAEVLTTLICRVAG
jgi:acetylornithine deacetylase